MLNNLSAALHRFCLLAVLHGCLLLSLCSSTTLGVIPAASTINLVATYTWTITGLSNASACSNCTVVLRFPPSTTFNSSSPTSILAWDNSAYAVANITFSNNDLSFALITDKSNSSFVFQTTNILNPAYQTI